MPATEPFTDLNAVFEDGYSLRYNMAQYGPQEVTISVHNVGELIVSSGMLIPCDLLIVPDDRYYLKKSVAPGRYPVILSHAQFQPSSESRIASAMLRFSNEAVVRWEIAEFYEPDINANQIRTWYGVDSGTGSFIDKDAAGYLAPLVWDGHGTDNKFEQFCSEIISELEQNSFDNYGIAGWANAPIGDKTNAIVFSCGWGDGAYESFWGYDSLGNRVSLATDFELFH